MSLSPVTEHLVGKLDALRFSAPITHVYNPLSYASVVFGEYLRRFGQARGRVLLVGMNPGPWGMVQTGVPFGEVAAVRDWMGLAGEVGQPATVHPKRPVQGFACHRSEVSGRRLWGWAREAFGPPEAFFAHYLVLNYCPLAFFNEAGQNVTPDKLCAADRTALYKACDHALAGAVEALAPRAVVGIGAFAETRIRETLDDTTLPIGRLPHPSPANPTANRGWTEAAQAALEHLGLPVRTLGAD